MSPGGVTSGALGLTAFEEVVVPGFPALVGLPALAGVVLPPALAEVLLPDDPPQPTAPAPRARIAPPAASIERVFIVPPRVRWPWGGEAMGPWSAPANAQVNARSIFEKPCWRRIRSATVLGDERPGHSGCGRRRGDFCRAHPCAGEPGLL